MSLPDNAIAELTKVVNNLSEDGAVTVDTLKRLIVGLSTKVNVTMVVIENLSPPSTGMGRSKCPSRGHIEGLVMRRSSRTFSLIWNNTSK